MLGYLKLKTNDEELYESDYLNYIKDNKWGKIQYYICNIYFKFVVLIKNFFNIITVKQIYNGFLFILSKFLGYFLSVLLIFFITIIFLIEFSLGSLKEIMFSNILFNVSIEFFDSFNSSSIFAFIGIK